MWWLTGIGLLFLANLLWIRPWQIRWGATDEEVARPLPGDGVVRKAHFNATRAVTVKATPAEIYPWLLQIGYGRAGWYSYDWVDNLGRPSAEQILPQYQGLAVGDLVPMFTGLGLEVGLWVREMQPPYSMVWWDKVDRTSWTWYLDPQPDGSTRLITRVRVEHCWLSPTLLFSLMLDVGDIIMMRKCMLGIKQRAERVRSAV